MHDTTMKVPGGGFLSTVEDLAGFAAALLGDELLTEEDKALAWVPQKLSNGAATTYGLGFGVFREDGRSLVQHTGSQEKTRTLMRMVPEKGLAVVLMSNSEWANLRPVAKDLVNGLDPR